MSQYFSVRPVGGGDDGIRTHDPLLAGQVLSQLSYTPVFLPGSQNGSLKIEQRSKKQLLSLNLRHRTRVSYDIVSIERR